MNTKGTIFYVCVLYKNVGIQIDSKNVETFDDKHKDITQRSIEDMNLEFTQFPKESIRMDPRTILKQRKIERNYNLWIKRDGVFIYACLTTRNFKKRIANEFINSINKVHRLKLSKMTSKRVIGVDLTEEQRKIIRKAFQAKLKYYCEENHDAITAGMKKLGNLEELVMKNIKTSIKRENDLDTFFEKTEAIGNGTDIIQDLGNRIKGSAYQTRLILLLFLILVVIFLLVIVSLIFVIKFLTISN